MTVGPRRERERFERYLGRMERGEYWLAHEELEALWLDCGEDELKGLIHLAAALLHAQRNNRRGAHRKAVSCLGLLGGGEEFRGLRLDPVREVANRIVAIAAGEGALPAVPAPSMSSWYRGTIDPARLEAATLPYRVRRHQEGYRTGRDPHRRDD